MEPVGGLILIKNIQCKTI